MENSGPLMNEGGRMANTDPRSMQFSRIRNIQIQDDNGNRIPATDTVRVSPMSEIDTTFVYNLDGTVQQIIQEGLGQTKTLVFTYSNGALSSIACVITQN